MLDGYSEAFKWAVAARASRKDETHDKLADELGLTRGVVRYWCRKYGSKSYRVYVTPGVAKRLRRMILRGTPVSEMAERLDIPERYVVDFVKRHARKERADAEG